jgi:hypothetical protein
LQCRPRGYESLADDFDVRPGPVSSGAALLPRPTAAVVTAPTTVAPAPATASVSLRPSPSLLLPPLFTLLLFLRLPRPMTLLSLARLLRVTILRMMMKTTPLRMRSAIPPQPSRLPSLLFLTPLTALLPVVTPSPLASLAVSVKCPRTTPMYMKSRLYINHHLVTSWLGI